MSLLTAHWLYHHFDDDALETASIRLTLEVFKTVAVIVFAVYVMELVL